MALEAFSAVGKMISLDMGLDPHESVRVQGVFTMPLTVAGWMEKRGSTKQEETTCGGRYPGALGGM